MFSEPKDALLLASTTCTILYLSAVFVRIRELHSIHGRKHSTRLLANPKNDSPACKHRYTTTCHTNPPRVLYPLISMIFWSYALRFFRFGILKDSSFGATLLATASASWGFYSLLLTEEKYSQHSDLSIWYLIVCILCDSLFLAMPSEVAGPIQTQRFVIHRCCINLVLLLYVSYSWNPSSHSTDEERHSLLDRVLFIWITPILLRGYKHTLTSDGIPNLQNNWRAGLTAKQIVRIWSDRETEFGTAVSLPLALMKCLKIPFLAAIVPRSLLIAARYSQPVLIEASIGYAAIPPAEANATRGYWLIVFAVAIYVGLALSTAAYQRRIAQLKLMTRSALMGLIHEKTMRLPSAVQEDGEAITLMSTEIDNLEGIAEMVHEIWAQLFEVLIGVCLLARQVGWIWPLPLVLIYLSSHVSRYVARTLQPRQKAWNNAIQTRVTATNSALQMMKVVKMIGLQTAISRYLQKLREFELAAASKLRWVMVYYNASANAVGIFSPAITLVVSALLSVFRGGNLDTTTAFTTMAILGMVTHPANMIMTIVPRVVAAKTGLDRIQAFLLQPSLQTKASISSSFEETVSKEDKQDSTSGLHVPSGVAIQLKEVQIGDTPAILRDINIEVHRGQLCIISGPTGSGKSTLLRAILGEVGPNYGSISLSPQKLSYCTQRPWLPNCTIKEVVCRAAKLPEPLHQERGEIESGDKGQSTWYDEVIKMCCLVHDLNSLPNGHETMIGTRGLNLSGGQRQRIALARALYARSRIVLLDDTFSGLDEETERNIFKNLFGSNGLLRRMETTVVLVSNSSQYFPAADHVVVLGDGGVVEQGKWQDLKIKPESIRKSSSDRPAKLDTVASASGLDKVIAQSTAQNESKQDLGRQTGDIALYGYYLGFIDARNLSYMVASAAIYAIFITIPQYWLRLWTNTGEGSTLFYVSGFLLISTLSWSFTSVMLWSVLIRISPQSGLRLHQRVLNIVTNAPLSFLSKTDSGLLLNRFTHDMQLVDKQLPGALQGTIVQITKLLMQVIVLCAAEKWLALSLPASMFIVYVVQKIYLRTARQLRHLELESRAKVLSSFLEIVEGLETIRAFDRSRAATISHMHTIENSQKPEFLLLCLKGWLNLVLGLLSAGIATTAIALAVRYHGYVSGAQVGIALNIMLVTNSTLLRLVENFTDFEISMGAISRLRELEKATPVEGDKTLAIETPESWPSRGQIDFKDITASYNADSIAIKNLSLAVSPGQKLVVCGRTGSGKSTLLLTLLRLLEPQSGKIELDGIDIKHVNLEILRQRCFIVMSQDPLALPHETLRFNLDPDSSASDQALISALIKVGLWSHFARQKPSREKDPSSDNDQILDQKVAMLQGLSVGQCQLLAVCRTLVKAASLQVLGLKPVVLLDEVTSSLDPDTESTIYRIVDEEFTEKGHTVIVIAHRLGALQPYLREGRDAVAFMADGKLQGVTQGFAPDVW